MVFFFVFVLDSSPKTPAAKKCHNLSKEAILNSPTAANITPIRSKCGRPTIVEESPTLSQEPVNVTWKWGSDSPVRSTHTNVLRTIRYPLATMDRLKLNTKDRPTKLCDQTNNDASKNSPKGLYKFQEEMRRINEDATSGGSDAGFSEDTGCPPDQDSSYVMSFANDSISMSPIPLVDAEEVVEVNDIHSPVAQKLGDETLNAIKNDLFEDSDFEQEMFSCVEKVVSSIELTQSKQSIDNKSNEQSQVKIIQQKPETKTESDAFKTLLFDNDESIDDLLVNIDDSFISNSVLKLNNSKLLRHNSMPPKRDPPAPPGRKSFTRHESMPISSANLISKTSQTTTVTSSQCSIESGMSSKLIICWCGVQ